MVKKGNKSIVRYRRNKFRFLGERMKYLIIVLVMMVIGSFLGNVDVKAGQEDVVFVDVQIIYPPLEMNNWESKEELKLFLTGDNTDSCLHLTPNRHGVFKIDLACVDRAESLRDNAAKIGRHLEIALFSQMEYKRRFGHAFKTDRTNAYHAVCLARIGDYFYCIEPDNDEIKRGYVIP